MPRRKKVISQMTSENDASSGQVALSAYARILDFLTNRIQPENSNLPADLDLPFIRHTEGLRNLLLSMSAVAPATPDTADEEWNPLSQRPHAVLPAAYVDGLGGEIVALKTAVDEFTILSHEIMHVGLWEPFFAGYWCPRSKTSFRDFSLRAEGFCYFFSDIVISGAIRTRLPDGEFALDRQTASNARFHPVRAFKAAGINNHREILEIYLEGFGGNHTALWQPRGANDFGAFLAAQAYDFYKGSFGYLSEMYSALVSFGCMSEFFKRFCAIPGLPTFLTEQHAPSGKSSELNKYFMAFFDSVLNRLDSLTQDQITRIMWRRKLQMRAYYSMQLRWLISSNHVVVAKPESKAWYRQIIGEMEAYLAGIEHLLHKLVVQGDSPFDSELNVLDAKYSSRVRSEFVRIDAWAGHRWLIAPSRAGGSINLKRPLSLNEAQSRKYINQTIRFLIAELSESLLLSKSDKLTATLLLLIKNVTEIGALVGRGNGVQLHQGERALKRILANHKILEIWSLPLSDFHPRHNRFRELLFSYQ